MGVQRIWDRFISFKQVEKDKAAQNMCSQYSFQADDAAGSDLLHLPVQRDLCLHVTTRQQQACQNEDCERI